MLRAVFSTGVIGKRSRKILHKQPNTLVRQPEALFTLTKILHETNEFCCTHENLTHLVQRPLVAHFMLIRILQDQWVPPNTQRPKLNYWVQRLQKSHFTLKGTHKTNEFYQTHNNPTQWVHRLKPISR